MFAHGVGKGEVACSLGHHKEALMRGNPGIVGAAVDGNKSARTAIGCLVVHIGKIISKKCFGGSVPVDARGVGVCQQIGAIASACTVFGDSNHHIAIVEVARERLGEGCGFISHQIAFAGSKTGKVVGDHFLVEPQGLCFVPAIKVVIAGNPVARDALCSHWCTQQMPGVGNTGDVAFNRSSHAVGTVYE